MMENSYRVLVQYSPIPPDESGGYVQNTPLEYRDYNNSGTIDCFKIAFRKSKRFEYKQVTS